VISLVSEFIISAENLSILFNILYQNGNLTFDVFPFLLKKNLFKFYLDKSIKINLLINKEEYNSLFNSELEYNDIFPSFEKVRNILLGSGFLQPENWNELCNKFEKIKRIDPLKGDRITYIGMDTNCYIHKFYTLIMRMLGRDSQKLCFVTSSIIENELKSMKKINSARLNEIKQIIKDYNSTFDEFWNSETIFARLKRLGLGEFRKLRKFSHCLMDSGIILRNDIENDYQILEDFRNQIIPRNSDLLVLTFDKQFYDMARGDGVQGILFTFPYLDDLPKEFIGDWDCLCDFVYLTSIYFGAISLRSKNNIQIFGIWRGKMPNDWDDEKLKVRIGSENIASMLAKQLNIVKN